MKKLNAKQLKEHIKKNGITLVELTKKYDDDVPKGTKLWFGVDGMNNNDLTSYNCEVNNKNKEFNYAFDYEWGIWAEKDSTGYKGKFELIEECKFKIGDKVKIRKDSQYRKQQYGSGIIIQYRKDTDYHYRVEWKETGFDEVYRDKDLEFVKEKSVTAVKEIPPKTISEGEFLATKIINLLEEGNKVVVKKHDDFDIIYPEKYQKEEFKALIVIRSDLEGQKKSKAFRGWNRKNIKEFDYTEIVEYELYRDRIKDYWGNHPKRTTLIQTKQTIDFIYNLYKEYLNNNSTKKGNKYMACGMDIGAMSKPSRLQKLSKTLKRVLNKDMRAQYKAGYRNGDLELTSRGIGSLLNLLAVEKEKELSDDALEYIAEVEKKDKK